MKHTYTHIFALSICLSAGMTIVPLAAAAAAPAEHTAVLCARFDSLAAADAPRAQLQTLADTLFAVFDREAVTDEPVVIPLDAPRDSLVMRALYWSAEWCYANDLWQPAIDYAAGAVPYAQHYGDEELLSDCLHLQGLGYFRKGEFESAADAFRATYEIDQRSGDAGRISSTLNSIAGTYVANNQYAEAERYILEAIEVNSRVDEPRRMAVLLGTASEVYHGLGDDTKALRYAEQALAIDRRLNNRSGQGKRLSQMATALIALNRCDDAAQALDEALPLLRDGGVWHSVAICERQYGMIETKRGNLHEAKNHFLAAADIFRVQGDKYGEMKAVKNAYDAVKDLTANDRLTLLERYNELRDTIYRTETTDALNRYNAEYGLDQLQAERERSLTQNRRYMILTAITIVLLLCFIFSLWYSIHRRNHIERDSLRKNIDDLQEINAKLNTWYNNVLSSMGQTMPDIPDADKQFLERVAELINSQMEQGNVSAEQIASDMNISVKQFRTRLVTLTGQNPREYILNVRMQKAKYLLTERKDLQVIEIARLCGYDDLSSFVHAFKKYFNLSPTAMRDRKANDQIVNE